MRTSFGPNRSSSLRIRESSTEEPDLGQIGEGSSLPALVVDRVLPTGPPSSSGKGTSKVSEIRYPGGSGYLRAAVQNAEAVGPSRIEPSFGKAFATRFRSPLWCSCLVPRFSHFLYRTSAENGLFL